jgi:hypothetical protein
MKLKYRGIAYNYNPADVAGCSFQPVRRSGSADRLSYRGISYNVTPCYVSLNTNSPADFVPSAIYSLIYRGVKFLRAKA